MMVPTEVEAREAWAQEAPRQWSISKQTAEDLFPGQYCWYYVQVAWEAWLEARQVPIKVIYDDLLNETGWMLVDSFKAVPSEVFNNAKPVFKKCLTFWLKAKGFRVEEEK